MDWLLEFLRLEETDVAYIVVKELYIKLPQEPFQVHVFGFVGAFPGKSCSATRGRGKTQRLLQPRRQPLRPQWRQCL
jgi:hypothetical protein